jgi:hypothetical protein
MDARSMALLEKAFDAEVRAAIQGGPRLMQTRSKLAEKLVADGYLEPSEEIVGTGWSRVIVKGYVLTPLGNMTYCMSCSDTA